MQALARRGYADLIVGGCRRIVGIGSAFMSRGFGALGESELAPPIFAGICAAQPGSVSVGWGPRLARLCSYAGAGSTLQRRRALGCF